MHLAQLNIARLRYQIGHPRVAGFVRGYDVINAAAERSEGFVWRYENDENNTAALSMYGDPMIIVNLSVWENPGHFEKFVWNTVHKQFYAQRERWFSVMEKQHFVMWFVEEGHRPSLTEAKERLDYLNENGNSDHAFGWSHLPEVKLWLEAQCA